MISASGKISLTALAEEESASCQCIAIYNLHSLLFGPLKCNASCEPFRRFRCTLYKSFNNISALLTEVMVVEKSAILIISYGERGNFAMPTTCLPRAIGNGYGTFPRGQQKLAIDLSKSLEYDSVVDIFMQQNPCRMNIEIESEYTLINIVLPFTLNYAPEAICDSQIIRGEDAPRPP